MPFSSSSHAVLPLLTVQCQLCVACYLRKHWAHSKYRCFALIVSASEQALQPNEGEVEELRGHVVIAGFGRVGQIIGQLLSERLIPFVALDVRSDRVQVCSH